VIAAAEKCRRRVIATAEKWRCRESNPGPSVP